MTPVGTSHLLLAIPVPLTESSVPKSFEGEEVEGAIKKSFFLLLSFFKGLSIDFESFQKPDEALALLVMEEPTNAHCSDLLQQTACRL